MSNEKQELVIKELLNLIPDASEIKSFISENDADEKMLDDFLFERIYKNKNWVEKSKIEIIEGYNQGFRDGEIQDYNSENDVSQFDDAENYYNNKYKSK